VQSSKLNRLM